MGLEFFVNQNSSINEINVSNSHIEETNSRLGFGFLVIFIYLLIGTIVFVKIEAPVERIQYEAYKEFRAAWEDKLTNLGMKLEDIDNLFSNIKDAALSGVWIEKNETSESNWTFGQTFFFCGTLISTVGYGKISPKTHYGKLFTIVYCIIGIPITLSFLSALVLRLRQPSNYLKNKLSSKLSHIFHHFQIQYIHLAVISIIVLVTAFIIPSYIFSHIETDWSFLDAFYYCFVSLTTIGLGDYIPGDSPNQSYRGIYKLLATIYLLFGLSVMMLFLATLYDIPQLNLTKFFISKNSDYVDLNNDDNTTTAYNKYKEEDDETGGIPINQYPYSIQNSYY
ncbi:Two pore domain potassium channel family and Two pore domain potassium channel, TWIK family and Two pore domain potassium channel domain-containing protein [Strongyloides ratti]|uniref:Two pore potassium channel protein sup-9 n=1 Tax=Strongyloides ratti TaxID=34506 RepID=A0A090L6J6_STRRB|nr:Two pore domain potassium channel family and Two pore domain potassium channel, TWIK family and Two pore domain potassium channel domain-containing protein [Strongyloides ratti]CEF63703.1 Two pore domain potassium channel family and Two pore domain potassium channel, TWIK family and Two pore domain potassium channel domain-containing protein [Strongyloides ratti]